MRIIFIVPNDSNPESNALSPSTVEWTKRKFLWVIVPEGYCSNIAFTIISGAPFSISSDMFKLASSTM